MRIAIDISQIIYETGVSTYTRNLCSNLLAIDKSDSYLFFGGSLRRYKKLKNILNGITYGKENAGSFILPFPPYLSDLMGNRLRFIAIDKILGNIDVFHSSDWTQPPAKAFKVTTIHDIVPILYPKLTHPTILRVHRKRLDIVRKEVDRIIVPSDTTKGDLVKIGFDDKRIRVIAEAPDRVFISITKKDALEAKKRYKISKKYLVAIGTHPRKNIDKIIDSFERIRPDKDLRLVVIGENKENKRYHGVDYLGHVSTHDVAAILKGAEVLVYPSFYEGFGLPIVEAYQCSIPVVTSNIGSMKEIGEGSAVLVDPNKTESITKGIWEALKNRSKYVKAGKIALKKYSWKKNASKTLAVYNEFLK